MRNQLKQKGNTFSIYKGVTQSGKYYKAGIGYNGKFIYLGSFRTEVDAAVAYNNSARKLFGEYANLNNV